MLLVVIIDMVLHEGWLRGSDSWGAIREIVFLKEIRQVVGSLNEVANPELLFGIPLKWILVRIASIPLEYVFYRTHADLVPVVIALQVGEIVLQEIQIIFSSVNVWLVLGHMHVHVEALNEGLLVNGRNRVRWLISCAII
jgi:hypothetical protein